MTPPILDRLLASDEPSLRWKARVRADGSWPADVRYYRVTDPPRSGSEAVDWAGSGRRCAIPWVSADALHVLRAAGRLPD